MAGTENDERVKKHRLYQLSTLGVWVVIIIVLFIVLESVFDDKVEEGGSVPDMDIKLVDKAGTTKFSEICSDRPVLLVFVSQGCGACKVQLISLANSRQKRSFDIYLVTHRSGEWLNKEFEEAGASFPVILDRDSDLHRTFRVVFYPTSALINTEREMVYKRRGYHPGLIREAESSLED